MKKVDLSIIIVSYNTKNLTLQCIKSIEKYPPKIKYEIIVIDNGSQDGSVDVLTKIKNIKLIKNKTNLGFAKANNIGIKASSGNNILLLNSDTQVTKSAIQKLYDFAVNTDNAGVVGSKLLNPDKSVQSSVFPEQSLLNAFKAYWLGKKKTFEKYAPSGDLPVKVNSIVGAVFFITQKALKKVGKLNEKYFMYFEDFDFCREVEKRGLGVYYLPDSEIIHHHGASGKDIKDSDNQWRRLIASSKTYHGIVKHYLLFLIVWSGQKLHR